jgi:hypothetical protein
MNLLVLIVQLIVLSEDIDSRMDPTGHDNLEKLTDMIDSIWRQMVQLHPKFAQDVHKDRMQRHMKPDSKKVFEDDSFIRSSLRHVLCTWGLAISRGEIAVVAFHRSNVGFWNIRWPKVTTYSIQGSHRRRNF